MRVNHDEGEQEAASDLELVRRIKAGEERAFEEMVERYHARSLTSRTSES